MEDTGGGGAALHIPPQILPPSASRGTPAPRAGQCSASTRAGWGGIRVEKGPGHVQGTREGSKSPPLRCLERGHARCSQQEQKSQDIPGEKPGYTSRKPGYISRKPGYISRKAEMQQQKSQDAVTAKLLHTRRKKNNSRGGCRSRCSSPAPSRAFWRSFGTISEPELIMELHTPPSKPGKHKSLQKIAVSKERLPSQVAEGQETPS